jgi:thioredoxin-related protein
VVRGKVFLQYKYNFSFTKFVELLNFIFHYFQGNRMKIIIMSLVVFAMINLNLGLKAEELKFETGSWEKAIELAQKSNKYIFVDAYTDWCGWCKVMDKETFTDKETIDFINANFIPVKYEMETGFGQKLAMKYRVRGFPTQLFFSPDGKLIYESAGYQPPKAFISTLQKVLLKENQMNLKGISNEIELNFPDFYKGAFAKNGSEEKKFPTKEQVVEYLEKRSDMFDEVTWSVLSQFESNEKYNNFFLENIGKYEELYGYNSINNKLYNLIYGKMKAAIDKKDENGLNEVLAMIDNYDHKRPTENKEFYTGMYYEKTGNWKMFAKGVDEKVNQNKLSGEQINEHCWNIYEKCDDIEILNQALVWIKPVTESSPNYANLDTYAALLYKTKNYSLAQQMAQKAIEAGKSNKENVKATEKLLEKIMENMR